MKLLKIILFLLVIALLVLFFYLNGEVVSFNYFFGEIKIKSAFLMFFSFLLGVIFNFLILYPMYLQKKIALKFLQMKRKNSVSTPKQIQDGN